MKNKIPNRIDEIIKALELVEEEISVLEKNEKNMTWESYDEEYTKLLDYQTELVQKQMVYTSESLSNQVNELEAVTKRRRGLRKTDTFIKRKAWSGIKKGATYAWENKGRLADNLMENAEKQKSEFLKNKSKAEKAVERDSLELVERKIKEILSKKRNDEVISTYEEFYIRAAKKKMEKSI